MPIRNSYLLLPLLAGSLLLAACSHKEAVLYSRMDQTPPESTMDLQALIDDTPDGGTVRIPKGRYVLKEGLIVSGRKNLTIACEPGSQILVDDISADVMEVVDCSNFRLTGAFLRHLKPLPNYECHGDVLKVRSTEGVTVENCELDGCGAIGLSAWGSANITVNHCLIRHNSFNALYLDHCTTVRVRNCVIQENANFLQMYGTDDVEMAGNIIRQNGGYWEKPENPGLLDQ